MEGDLVSCRSLNINMSILTSVSVPHSVILDLKGLCCQVFKSSAIISLHAKYCGVLQFGRY